jgi:hypothetical protein
VVQKVQQRVLEPAAAVAAPAAAAAPGAAPAVAAQQQNVTTETVEEEDPTVLQFNLQKVENSLPWRRLINAIKRGETGIVVLTGTTRGLDRNQKVYLTFVLGSDAAVGTNSDTTSVPAKETAETERELPLPREEVETSIRTAINLCAAKGDPIPERDIRRTGLLVPGGVFGTLAVFPGAKLDLGLRDKSQQPVLFWRFRGDKITTPQSLNLGVATSEQNTEVQAIKQTFTARFGSALAAKTHVVLLRQNGALGCLATICVRLSLPEGDQPCLYAVLGDASSPAYVKIDTPVLYSDRTGFVSITTAWGGPLLVCEEPLPNT